MKKLLRALSALYARHPTVVTYMLQNTEYSIRPYLAWYWRTQDFSTVMHRRLLDPTRRALAVCWLLRAGMILQVVVGLGVLVWGLGHGRTENMYFGAAALISYPVIWAQLIVIPLLLSKWLIVRPSDARLITASEKLFAAHSGAKIAVVGSYGKTTMKELLQTILGTGLKVAATPGNKNVSVSHALFAKSLAGNEDVLIIEYGEGKPGDVARFARQTHPTHAVVTGVAAAHLDAYKTVERAAEDIFSIRNFVPAEKLYVNGESPVAVPLITDDQQTYSRDGLGAWKVSEVAVNMSGTEFSLKHGKTHLHLHSGLLGRHQVGPITAAVALAAKLGLSEAQIIKGVAVTVPFEHRLQPYRLAGAWIIDDTYNGNLEGIRAGAALLAELPAPRKWYVTPGLVDQGAETAQIHKTVGELIAAAKPDVVVLMQNSVTKYVKDGLRAAGFTGELRVEIDPLQFYTNLEQFLAAGDLVLMQNDWTDNYA